jgi:hypothetical protein
MTRPQPYEDTIPSEAGRRPAGDDAVAVETNPPSIFWGEDIGGGPGRGPSRPHRGARVGRRAPAPNEGAARSLITGGLDRGAFRAPTTCLL